MKIHRTAAALFIFALLVASGCGGGSDDGAAGPSEAAPDGVERDGTSVEGREGRERAPESAQDIVPDAPDEAIGDRPGGGGEEDPGPATREPSSGQEREIGQAVRAYLRALRERDGATLCSETFLPGALDGMRLPVRGRGCAASVSASIGRAAEPGAPRWLGAALTGARTVILVDGGDGRLTATIANRVAGSDRTWIEDDVIYLRELEGQWRIAKPSAVFYRAVGYVEIPIRALTPPDGL